MNGCQDFWPPSHFKRETSKNSAISKSRRKEKCSLIIIFQSLISSKISNVFSFKGKKMNKSTYLITTLFKRKFNFSFTPVFLFDFWMRYVTNVIFGRHFFPSLPPPTSLLPPPYFPSFPFLYIFFFSFLSQTSWYFCDEIFNFINLSCISLVFK